MHWWKHYGFSAQPHLDVNSPLATKDDLELFFGRQNELQLLQTNVDTETKICFLIVGDAGVGKTTLQNKAFEKTVGFIHVNFAKVSGRTPDREIARTCIQRLKEKRIKASDLQKKLNRIRTHTTGRTFNLGALGTGVSSINQTTETLDRNIELEEIIKTSCNRLSKKHGLIVLALDEADFLGDGNTIELSKLCKRMIDLLPKPSVVILTHRDEDEQFEKTFRNTKSLVRTTFDGMQNILSLWNPGEGNVKALLKPRFQRGHPAKNSKFPLSDQACYWLDVLSCGNVRELLRYTKHVLIHATSKSDKPIAEEFVLECLIKDFPELKITGEEELTILRRLKEQPSTATDETLVKLVGSRSTLQRRFIDLEQLWFVKHDVKGKKHIYSLTKKAEILLEMQQ